MPALLLAAMFGIASILNFVYARRSAKRGFRVVYGLAMLYLTLIYMAISLAVVESPSIASAQLARYGMFVLISISIADVIQDIQHGC